MDYGRTERPSMHFTDRSLRRINVLGLERKDVEGVGRCTLYLMFHLKGGVQGSSCRRIVLGIFWLEGQEE